MDDLNHPYPDLGLPSGRTPDQVLRDVRAAGERRRRRIHALAAVPAAALVLAGVAAGVGADAPDTTRVLNPTSPTIAPSTPEEGETDATTTSTPETALGPAPATGPTSTTTAPQAPRTSTTNAGNPVGPCPRDDMLITVVADKDSYARGEPVHIKVTVKNVTHRRCYDRPLDRFFIWNDKDEVVHEVYEDASRDADYRGLEPNQEVVYRHEWRQCADAHPCQQVLPGEYWPGAGFQDWRSIGARFTIA